MKQLLFNYSKIIKRVCLGLALGLVVSFCISGTFALDDAKVKLVLNGDREVVVNVGSSYQELGAKLVVSGQDLSSSVIVDSNDVDVNKVGTYEVRYKYMLDEETKEYEFITRTVRVVDKSKPVIVLNGQESVMIKVGDNYVDEGYVVSDNYDSEDKLKVIVDNNVNNEVAGDYVISYIVRDTSGNKTVAKRYVKVVGYNDKGVVVKGINEKNYSNTVIKNSFTSMGIDITGYIKNSDDDYFIRLKKRNSKKETVIKMDVVKNHYYNGEIRIMGLENGTYDVFVESGKEERLLNKLNKASRIVRARIGNKLVTMDYDNDEVSFKVEDFKYEYDVLIDAGHGATEIGTEYNGLAEKEINLKLSQYEKCRFEEHGLKVLMTRDDDSDGIMMDEIGSKNKLTNRAYAIGYYGVVTRVAYSNHHNGSEDKSYSGYEVLVQAGISDSDLDDEIKIAKQFNQLYSLKENHMRFYAKDFASEITYDKLKGQRYNFNDYYVVLRIPYNLFNAKFVIYEGAYMSNDDDFNWYYKDGNMIKVSEVKIKQYVSSLGKAYKSDNSSCLQYIK